jgi:pimeloyl-ACP methyl ester carboxylesterase
MASVRSPDVAFIVLLAGGSVPGDEILLAQGELILRANGASEEDLATQRQLQLMIFAAVRADTGWDGVRGEIERQIRESIAALPPAQQAAITDVESFVKTRADQQVLGVRLPWFRFFLDFDPRTVLSKVSVPVLALFGEKDLQVPPDQSVEPMREAFAAAPTTDVTIEVLPGANHLFQAATTGSPNEYALLKMEFVPGFLDQITAWIEARF